MSFKKIAALAFALAVCPLFAATSSAAPGDEKDSNVVRADNSDDAVQIDPCTQGCQQAGFNCKRGCRIPGEGFDPECLAYCMDLQAECIQNCNP